MISKPTLPTEVIEVPDLGTVEVVGMTLTEREAALRDAQGRSRMEFVIGVLARAVRDPETHERAMTVEEWDVFGGVHQEAAVNLFETALRLSGLARGQQDPKA